MKLNHYLLKDPDLRARRIKLEPMIRIPDKPRPFVLLHISVVASYLLFTQIKASAHVLNQYDLSICRFRIRL